MKKGAINLFLVFGIVLLLSFSFVSANVFSDIWGKFTGKVIDAPQSFTTGIITFEKVFGGEGNSIGRSVIQTTDGDYIFTGSTSSLGSEGFKAWLVKVDSHGNLLWNKTFGNETFGSYNYQGQSVKQTSDGGYIIAGYIEGGSQSPSWLIKMDSLGNIKWKKAFYGEETRNIISSVQQTSDGGYITIGNTNSPTDIWLAKTDSLGEIKWSKTFGNEGYDHGNSVQQTSDGGYIVGGSISLHQDIFGMTDYAWLVKTSPLGNIQWNKTFGGWCGGKISSVRQMDDGGYILYGEFCEGGLYPWLAKTDSLGNIEWNKTFYGNAGKDGSVQQTSDGGYILVGRDSAIAKGSSFLIKTDSLGNIEWNRTFGNSNYDIFYSVQQTYDKGYIAVGIFGTEAYLVKTDIGGVIRGNNNSIVCSEPVCLNNLVLMGTGEFDFNGCEIYSCVSAGCSIPVCGDGNTINTGEKDSNGCEIYMCSSSTNQTTCSSGCLSDGKCVDIGYRKSGTYCNESGQFTAQYNADEICDNNFQCGSNLCISGKCVSQGLFDKILSWFKNIFG